MRHISGELIIFRVWWRASLFLPLLLFSVQAAAEVGFNAPVKFAVGGSSQTSTATGNVKVFGDYAGPGPVMGLMTLITTVSVGVDPRWMLTSRAA